VLLILEDDVVQ